MWQCASSPSRIVRAVLFLFICTLLMLLFGDRLVTNLTPRRKPCSNERDCDRTRTLPLHLGFGKGARDDDRPVELLLVFTNSRENGNMRGKLSLCLSSLAAHATVPFRVQLLTDQGSLDVAVDTVQKALLSSTTSIQVIFEDVENFTRPLQGLIQRLKPHFTSKSDAYYSNSLFFLSIGLYKLLPQSRVISVDIDVKFLSDIRELSSHFDNFSSEAMIGIAREQQPVYRHVLHEYRRRHNGTMAGDPPPHGKPGFNSGVLLLDLEKMRNSSLYARVVDEKDIILGLVGKYKFQGHLGDQDFYTLLGLDHPELFYKLPCLWNRQLCQWWRKHGYEKVFDEYYACSGEVRLLHGNCNTPFPEIVTGG